MPFKFEKMWMEHDGFLQFIEDNWNNSNDVVVNLRDLIVELTNWNWKVFGDLERKKNFLLRRMAGIQRKRPVAENEAGYLSSGEDASEGS